MIVFNDTQTYRLFEEAVKTVVPEARRVIKDDGAVLEYELLLGDGSSIAVTEHEARYSAIAVIDREGKIIALAYLMA